MFPEVGQFVTRGELDFFRNEVMKSIQMLVEKLKSVKGSPVVQGYFGKRLDLNDNLNVIELNKRINDVLAQATAAATAAASAGGEESMYIKNIDDAGGGVVYIGEAAQGAADSGASWRIRKIIVSSDDVDIAFSPNFSSFGDVWNNRTSLTYS